MMKAMKKLCFLATIVALVALLSFSVSAADTWYTLDGIVGGQLQFDPETGYVTGIERSVTSATIPSAIDGVAVTGLYANAFYAKDYLTYLSLPASVINIPSAALRECSSLTHIDVAADNPAFCSIDGVLFTADGTVLRMYPAQRPATSYTIPDTVTSVYTRAFAQSTNLTQIVVPDTVSLLGDSAFQDCSSLTDITLPQNLSSLSNSLFNGCSSLQTLTIPSSVRTIGDYAFMDCTSLTHISIPDGVYTIGSGAFLSCNRLSSIILPNALTELSTDLFIYCTSLTQITIPQNVTHVGNKAFCGTGLETIDIPYGVTRVGSSCFSNCTNLRQVTIPETVKTIAWQAFNECTSLATIQLPQGLETLESQVFWDCTALQEITIPSTVTDMSSGVFIGCSNLTKANILGNVEFITYEMFAGCTSLQEITLPASLTEIRRGVFNNCTSLKQVYFGGSQSQWSNVIIEEYNTALDGATFHYNSQTAPIPVTNTATLSDTKLQVNGTAITPQAYLINDNNYIKLRDLATMLAGTAKEFEVTWNNELGTIEMQSGKAYTAVGGEMTTSGLSQAFPIENTAPIYLDGELVELTAYTINDNNYFKLRDVMRLLDVFVGYDNETATATLDTSLSYTEE